MVVLPPLIQHRRSNSTSASSTDHLLVPNLFRLDDFKHHIPWTSCLASLSLCVLQCWYEQIYDCMLHTPHQYSLFVVSYANSQSVSLWPVWPCNGCVRVWLWTGGGLGGQMCEGWYEVYATAVNGGNWVIRCGDTLPAVPGNGVLQLPPLPCHD